MYKCIKKYLKYIVVISIFSFIIIDSIFPKDSIINNITKTVPVLTIVYVLYSKYLWKFNPIEKIPRLHKNYTGVFVSTYKNKKNFVDLQVKQTLFNVQIIYKTKESCSSSMNAYIYCERGEWKLIYNYLNEPDNIYRNRSEIHYGTCILSLGDVKNINGKYYTDRKTTGDITLKFVLH